MAPRGDSVNEPGTEALHRHHLRAAWENAGVAMLVLDDAGHFIAANKAAAKLTGYTRSEIERLMPGHHLAADDAGRGAYADILKNKNMRGTYALRRKDGSTINVLYWVIPTVVAKSPCLIALVWPDTDASPT